MCHQTSSRRFEVCVTRRVHRPRHRRHRGIRSETDNHRGRGGERGGVENCTTREGEEERQRRGRCLPGWHEVVVVDHLDERLDSRPLGHHLLAHALCHLQRRALNSSDECVGERTLRGSIRQRHIPVRQRLTITHTHRGPPPSTHTAKQMSETHPSSKVFSTTAFLPAYRPDRTITTFKTDRQLRRVSTDICERDPAPPRPDKNILTRNHIATIQETTRRQADIPVRDEQELPTSPRGREGGEEERNRPSFHEVPSAF
jgi:hypothetical protein